MGYPGAIYKSFPTWDEAIAYLEQGKSEQDQSLESPPSEAIAYIDGSYDPVQKAHSYGIVFFVNGTQYESKQRFEGEELRNVSGEVRAAIQAMYTCVCNGYKSLDLYYDYEGIERWCVGDWEATKQLTIYFKNYYDSIKDNLKVNFIKVASRSGNPYNDLADKLAKEALSLA